MKTMLVIVCTIALVSLGFAQGFHSVYSPDGAIVYAVGKQGTIFQSFDGGVTWSSSQQGTGDFRGVHGSGNAIRVVGDNGVLLKSVDAGQTWSQTILSPGLSLRAIAFASPTRGWIVGDSGAIFKSTDAGTTWNRISRTTQVLTAVSFADSLTGFIAGYGGTLLRTVDGGITWVDVAGGSWTSNLTSVAAKGGSVYVTGLDAFCARSTDGGTSWTPLKFNTDSRSDVNGVFLKSEDDAVFIGGGGYIRESTNGGSSFTWGVHSLYASLSGIFFQNSLKGWACSDKFNVVLRTTDGGATWQLPQGTTVTSTWTQKLAASGAIGDAFMINPWDKNKIYCALGPNIYMSANRGETWMPTASISSTGGTTNSFYISSKDTNIYIATYTGGGDHITRSTNRGVTWTTTIARTFSFFGMPLERDGSHPDTLFFGPEDGHLYRSTDFGATWMDFSTPGFTSPCDFVVVRDSANILWCGDSGPSRISRSTDGGLTWTLVYSGSGSEVPTIANAPLSNSSGYATAWGAGGVQKTTNHGATWTQTSTAGSAWGVDVAKDDPNVVMFGVYGGGQSYLSTNAGSSFATSPLAGSNYAILAYDRGTFLAEQSGGLYKLVFTYTVPTSNAQAVGILSPNGGENWAYGTTHNIAWAAGNLSAVKIEFQTAPGPSWQVIAPDVPAASGVYAWTIPAPASNQVLVRVSDAFDGSPADTSNSAFTISVAGVQATPTLLAFGNAGVGIGKTDTVHITNTGTATLVVSSAATHSGIFMSGRSALTIPPGGSDTLGVRFLPAGVQSYTDTLDLSTNTPAGVIRIPLTGTGVQALSVIAPNGGEQWQVNSTHNITWSALGLDRLELTYRISPTDSWRRISQSVDAGSGSYAWLVPNTPTVQARVRIIDRATGASIDTSDNVFSIVSSTSVAESGIPATYELKQNYPNPFNPSTRISYGLPKDGLVKLTIFNTLGQEIGNLINEVKQAGRYTIEFSTLSPGKDFPSGVYYYRLSAGDFSQTRKFILLK